LNWRRFSGFGKSGIPYQPCQFVVAMFFRQIVHAVAADLGDSTPKYSIYLTSILSQTTTKQWPPQRQPRARHPPSVRPLPRSSLTITDFLIPNPLLYSHTQRCQGKSRQKSRSPRRTRTQYAQDAVLCHLPPSQDPEAPSRTQVPAEIDSACAQDGSIPNHCFVRRHLPTSRPFHERDASFYLGANM